MRASLDTDIIIHLYKAGNKQLVYSLFDEVYAYEYLVEKELKNKAYRLDTNMSLLWHASYYELSIHLYREIGLGIPCNSQFSFQNRYCRVARRYAIHLLGPGISCW